MLLSIPYKSPKIARPFSLAPRGGQEFRATLEAMQEVLATITAAPRGDSGALGGATLAAAVAGNAATAAGWAGGWARWALARADVAVVALSRRVLLDRLELHGGASPPCVLWGWLR